MPILAAAAAAAGGVAKTSTSATTKSASTASGVAAGAKAASSATTSSSAAKSGASAVGGVAKTATTASWTTTASKGPTGVAAIANATSVGSSGSSSNSNSSAVVKTISNGAKAAAGAAQSAGSSKSSGSAAAGKNAAGAAGGTTSGNKANAAATAAYGGAAHGVAKAPDFSASISQIAEVARFLSLGALAGAIWAATTTPAGGESEREFERMVNANLNAKGDKTSTDKTGGKKTAETGATAATGVAAKPYIDDEAAKHILEGDAKGGGHRPGTGAEGKSEFPPGWSDKKILGEIKGVANDPNATRVAVPGSSGRTVVTGTRDGVDIRVVVEKNGRIVTGYPTNTPRNK